MTTDLGRVIVWSVPLEDPAASSVDPAATVAVVAAVVGIAATVYGMWERRRAFHVDRSERDRTFLAQQQEFHAVADKFLREIEEGRTHLEVEIKKEFLLEHYRSRLTPYALVFRALGAVSLTGEGRLSIQGVPIGQIPEAYQTAHRDCRRELESFATTLYEHVYGDAGLLMNQVTRDHVATARIATIDFLEADGEFEMLGNDLVNAFYDARRYLLGDAHLFDNTSVEALIKQIHRTPPGEARAGIEATP